jgi:hypothetical protein
MADLHDEQRVLRERIEDLERRLESRIQDDGAVSSPPDVLRYIRFPLGGIGGGQTAYVDWFAGGGGWQTGAGQLYVIYRGPATTTVGQGLDPRTSDRRTGYAAWNAPAGTWDVIQEFC